MKQLSIIHLVQDDKFFYPVKELFDNDKRWLNQYLFIKPASNYKIQFIKPGDAVCLSSKREIKRYLNKETYQYILFHAMPARLWPVINYIPSNVSVIWWAWGFDTYTSYYGIKPFLPLTLFLPRTSELLNNRLRWFQKMVQKITDGYRYLMYKRYRDKIVSRVDYFMPIIRPEFSIMKNNEGFHAKEFYFEGSIAEPVDADVVNRNPLGSILAGNSATYTNNHLDVFYKLSEQGITDRRIYVPLSYGDKGYANRLKSASGQLELDLHYLDTFLPKDEYYNIMNECSYFICGCIRQQAMNNVYYCLDNHIKIFLYKDSLIYKYLKESGYVVYAIEDICVQSLSTPLSEDEMAQNSLAYKRDFKRREDFYESFMKEQLDILKDIN